MRHAMEEPAQGRAFQSPRHGDPLTLELDRENQGDEEQRRAAKPREDAVASHVPCGKPFQQHDDAAQQRQRERYREKAHYVVRPRGVHHAVDE